MSYEPATVANAVLQNARPRGVFVDHMKLQKLVFLVHAWMLALHDRPAVNAPPEAWTYGPVFGRLYSALRDLGRSPVQAPISGYDPKTGQSGVFVPTPQDTQLWSIVDQVLQRYGSMSALQLSTLSHEPGGPWDQAQRSGQPMTDDSIKAYYRAKLATP